MSAPSAFDIKKQREVHQAAKSHGCPSCGKTGRDGNGNPCSRPGCKFSKKK
jgi:hypothetical protein